MKLLKKEKKEIIEKLNKMKEEPTGLQSSRGNLLISGIYKNHVALLIPGGGVQCVKYGDLNTMESNAYTDLVDDESRKRIELFLKEKTLYDSTIGSEREYIIHVLKNVKDFDPSGDNFKLKTFNFKLTQECSLLIKMNLSSYGANRGPINLTISNNNYDINSFYTIQEAEIFIKEYVLKEFLVMLNNTQFDLKMLCEVRNKLDNHGLSKSLI